MAKTETIIFHKGASPYISGDRATFPDAKAKEYVNRGVATYANRQMVSERAAEAPSVTADDSDQGEAPEVAQPTRNPRGRKRVSLESNA